ncbi:MAG: hypothetical protein R3253_07195 [Longimicrobiales bacterium]|nr:hypothetical protein [Longimicrobiales bacterium]
MKRLILFPLLALALACEDPPTSPESLEAHSFGIVGSETPAGDAGAVVLNRGAATPTGFCRFRGNHTDEITGVISPNGNALLNCQYDDYPLQVEQTLVLEGWNCFLTYQGEVIFTNETRMVISPSGQATQSCHFQGDRTPPGDPEAEQVGSQCRGQIISAIASTWPYPDSRGSAEFFAPPPGALALWLQAFAPYGVTTVAEAMAFFCG